jgi:PadR family transcriptional regulator AphA
MAPLTTTSYAILGLLAIKSWTTYELAQQMHRSLRNIWPRAQSRIYEEPKRLVEFGLAEAVKDRTGRRPRTTYTITDAGRAALKQWLAAEGSGPILEFESLVQVFYAEHSTKAETRERIAEIRAWAEKQTAENIAFARLYRETGGPFPQRLASIVLVGKFLTDFADMVTAWAEWADETVAAWPRRGRPEPAWDVIEEIAARPEPTPDRRHGG